MVERLVARVVGPETSGSDREINPSNVIGRSQQHSVTSRRFTSTVCPAQVIHSFCFYHENSRRTTIKSVSGYRRSREFWRIISRLRDTLNQNRLIFVSFECPFGGSWIKYGGGSKFAGDSVVIKWPVIFLIYHFSSDK